MSMSRRRSLRVLPLLVAAALAQVSGQASALDGMDSDPMPGLKGAAGAVVGGILGNQVGGGQGRTAATALGAAAGTVIASGCRVTGGTVIGGLLGGLLGSQIGGGNGKNVMAGVGASLGVFLGSDCSPVAMAALPEPVDLPAIQINGLRAVPMSGFPLAAFNGVPPIVTPQDIAAAGQVVQGLSAQAKDAYSRGDAELAVLSLYWAKRISAVALGVADASQQTMASFKGGKATIPGKAVVILPAFDQHDDRPRTASTLPGEPPVDRLAEGLDLSRGIAVADNTLDSVLSIMKALGGPQPAAPRAMPGGPAAGGVPDIPRALQGFPENQVLRLPDGTMVMKTGEALTVYNPGDQAIQLPLDQLDFVPRTPEPSSARIAAADLMKTIAQSRRDWFFRIYVPATAGRASCAFAVPNKVVVETRGVAAYIDEGGKVSLSSRSGEVAYKTRPDFRLAMDLLQATDQAAPVLKFVEACQQETKGNYSEYQGRYANLAKRVCFSGAYSNPVVFRSKSFYVGESGRVVLTMDSLLEDRAVLSTMNKALADGQALSDLMSFVPWIGNLESASQCLGKFTMAQQSAVRKALGGDAFAKARLAGWQQPDTSEWGFDRVVNCLGVIPLAGEVAAGAKATARAAGGAKVLAGLGERVDLMKSLAKAFDSPRAFADYVAATRSAEDLVPGNAKASAFVKTIFTGLMKGQNMSATASGAWHFGADSAPSL